MWSLLLMLKGRGGGESHCSPGSMWTVTMWPILWCAMSLSFVHVSLSFIHLLLLFISCWLPHHQWWCGLLLVWEKKRGRGGTLLTLINMNMTTTCVITIWMTWHVRCSRHHPLLLFVHWAGDVALPCCCHCWGGWQWLNNDCGWWWLVVAVAMKQRWLWWWWCGGGWEGNHLFVDDVNVMFLANTAHYILEFEHVNFVYPLRS